MKTSIVLLFVGASFFNCSGSTPNHKQRVENETVVLSPTPETDECRKENFKHKSEAEIATMTPAQRIDEMVKDQTYHMPSLDDDYGFLVSKYIKKDGVKILPVLIEYMKDLDPNSFFDCRYRAMRFIVASLEAGDLDHTVRLRGTKEGQSAIEALERGIERMKMANFDKDDHRWNSNYDYSLLILEGLKGINGKDLIIKDTLRVRHKVQMTEDELLEFSNFLTSLDPNYPSWSEVKDGSDPLIMKNSEKYYEAYRKFKKKN
jgi:uncharacterized protein YdhG (YjbR/CyaY superfamily)